MIREILDLVYLETYKKVFNTVDHEILLSKLGHFDIRGISSNWFISYLFNWKQFVSINVNDAGHTERDCGVQKHISFQF